MSALERENAKKKSVRLKNVGQFVNSATVSVSNAYVVAVVDSRSSDRMVATVDSTQGAESLRLCLDLSPFCKLYLSSHGTVLC